MVILTYVAVVVSLGRTLHDGERSLLLLSMGAALFAALVYLPAREVVGDREPARVRRA